VAVCLYATYTTQAPFGGSAVSALVARGGSGALMSDDWCLLCCGSLFRLASLLLVSSDSASVCLSAGVKLWLYIDPNKIFKIRNKLLFIMKSARQHNKTDSSGLLGLPLPDSRIEQCRKRVRRCSSYSRVRHLSQDYGCLCPGHYEPSCREEVIKSPETFLRPCRGGGRRRNQSPSGSDFHDGGPWIAATCPHAGVTKRVDLASPRPQPAHRLGSSSSLRARRAPTPVLCAEQRAMGAS
jgi:hypothetical protein